MIERSGTADASTRDELSWLPVELIDGSRGQPRRTIRNASLDDLVESVLRHGILQPIRVRRRGQRYEVIAGHRRLLAATRAGLSTVPAVVVDAGDDQVLIEALIENIQREELSPIERGDALRRLRESLGAGSWEEVGRAIGISRRHVYHLLNVVELPELIREDIQAGSMSEKHGRALLRLRNHPDLQMQLWRRITTDHISGDEAMSQARLLAGAGAEAAPDAAPGRQHPLSRGLPELIAELLGLLSEASGNEIEPLRGRLERLARRIGDLLEDAFYAEEREEDVVAVRGGSGSGPSGRSFPSALRGSV